MAQLRRDHSKFEANGTKVVVVGPDTREAFAKYWEEHDLPFVGLPDPKYRVLKLYGQEIKIFKFGRMPAQALVDKAGIVRFVHYGHDMSDIPSTEEMLELIETVNDEAPAPGADIGEHA
jgi:peroxiredoxin